VHDPQYGTKPPGSQQSFVQRTKLRLLEPPGPAIGILRKLLPHPEEWGFAGYDGAGSPLLPDQRARPKALVAPEKPNQDE